MTVGAVELFPATVLAQEAKEYAELTKMGDREIPTLMLNQDYYGLKKYLGARASDLTEGGLEGARDRYAVGVGVGLCMLHKETQKRRNSGESIAHEWLKSSNEALARSVLSMMPEYDALAKQAGIKD